MTVRRMWPKDRTETASFVDLLDPVLEALRFAYTLRRKNKGKDVPWTGPVEIPCSAATCPPPAQKLSAESLAFAEEDQCQKPIEVILMIAIQLGIEQGIRHEKAEQCRWK